MIRLLRYTLLTVILSACTAHFQVSEVKSTHYELKTSKNDSTALLSALPYKEKLDLEMKQVIAYSDSSLTKEGNDVSLGNFACGTVEDYIRTNKNEIAGKYIVILNRGGLRNSIPSGEITKGHIFELMPFDNELVILKISGEKIMECIHSMIKDKKLISRNLSFAAKNNEVTDIKIWGIPFNIKEDYYVVTTDYLAMGGDNCSFFGKPISVDLTFIKLRDVMINYCLALTKINKHIIPERNTDVRISK